MEDKQEQHGLIPKKEKTVISASYSLTEKIKSRESWAKIIFYLIVTALVAYKIAITEINLDFSNFSFSFTDLLSLTLAIFAIATSIAFYFKATDTSNRFYDNTFKFTKDISIILGRIEAGFGERLKHIDEGYASFRDKFEFGGSSSDVLDAKKLELEEDEQKLDAKKIELEEDQQKLKKEISEKDQILSTLMDQAKLDESQKKEVISKLKNKDYEILKLNRELRNLKREIKSSEQDIEDELINETQLLDYLSHLIKSGDFNRRMIRREPLEVLLRELKLDFDHHDPKFYEDLLRNGFISNDGRFTIKGVKTLKLIEQRI